MSAETSHPKREDIEGAFEQISQVIHAAMRPLPTQTGDYSYPPEKEVQASLFSQLKHLNIKNIDTLKDMALGKIEGKPIDDKDYLMERVIQLAAELPLNSKLGRDLTGGFLTQLWTDLQHPPLSYLGEDFIYRKADGSNNNIMWPQIGAAGTSYARTVQPKTIQPIDLPEPEVIFDAVMARKSYKEHPNKISSVLYYLASIIIHDIFRTSHRDFTKSETSSYLDLAPLYGSNQEEQDAMRTFEDGKLKPDCFSETRVLGFPPGVGTLLIMFNRFHNHTVEQLALINENDRFKKPASASNHTEYDNHLFQTGRLITCGLYINIILKDYVRTILNLNRTDSPWNLDPRTKTGKDLFGGGAPEAGGNQVSAEFNLVYRWHSCISQKDEKWSEELYARLFKGKKPSEVGREEFLDKLKELGHSLPKDPHERPFAGLKRDEEGRFDDNELATIFAESVEDCAGAYGANQVPVVMKAVEVLGIQQARSWNLATLNEFREYFHLARHETFESINPDPEVAEQLKRLYDHPDFVELYPGIAVESAKEPMKPGSGLCTTWTISRAVLSDAVALVRGDRFYTIDYTPKNLTNWGYKEVDSDLSVNNGCVFYKLILRAFPQNFKQNSIYAHYPLVIPEENKLIMKDLGHYQDYDFSKPEPIPEVTFISSYAACKAILSNQIEWKVTWGETIEFLMHQDEHHYGKDFCLSGDRSANMQSRKIIEPALYQSKWEREVKDFYEQQTLKMLHEHAYKLAGENQIDIVRDVSNPVQTHFAASIFSLPLKTEENPRGIFAESELYMLMALVFIAIFFDADPAKSFPMRQAARKVTQKLAKLVEMNVNFVKATGFVSSLLESFHQHDALTDYGVHMIQRLLKSGLSTGEIVCTNILPTAGGMVANQSQLFSQCLDYYLSEEGKQYLPEIHRLAHEDTPQADDLLLHYFMEGSRLRSVVGLYRQATKDLTVVDGKTTHHIKAGHKVMCNLITASHDPKTFPKPEKVDLTRPLDSYIHYGMGPHQCLGYGMSKIAMTSMLKTVGKLKNLRRAPGRQGEIKKVNGPHGFTLYMTQDQSSLFPFPSGMKVRWDGDLPPLETDG